MRIATTAVGALKPTTDEAAPWKLTERLKDEDGN